MTTPVSMTLREEFESTRQFVTGAIVGAFFVLLCFYIASKLKGEPSTSKGGDAKSLELESAEAPAACKTVITFGTFDVLHYGHIRILERARAHGQRLVVGLSTDELNMSKKNRAPLYSFGQRKAILEALSCVDEVFPEESLDLKPDYCKRYGADVLVMGDDWAGKFDAVGVEVRYLERTPAISTTETIELCRQLPIDKKSA